MNKGTRAIIIFWNIRYFWRYFNLDVSVTD